MKLTIDTANNTVTIVMPIGKVEGWGSMPIQLRPSASGKTTIIAGTQGFTPTTEVYNGKPVSVSVNVTIPNR
jgi:hypothetical protein